MVTNIEVSVAQLVPVTEAEGLGKRFAIWFQGCPLRCPGCCNPEMLPFEGGVLMQVGELVGLVDESVRRHQVEGITLLGGEPFAHSRAAAELAKLAQDRGLSVMVFSGYTLEEIHRLDDRHASALLSRIDILVDGPYLRDLPEQRRRWIGSANQRIHFLTDRYQADDPRWRQPNTLEIRLDGAGVTVNGFPAAGAVEFWCRPNKGTRND